MPRRPPIDPFGAYHVSSRGTYGRTLFESVGEHECFLRMYTRVARKYRWATLAWALMKNHHHFAIRLSEGGLSEGMQELHGGYSRWIHELYGQTRKGHLFRHAFYARRIEDDTDLITTCTYIDLNPASSRPTAAPLESDWCSYAATTGRAHPRTFHAPSLLLELFDHRPAVAQRQYRSHVEQEHVRRRPDPSPNDGLERG